MEAASFTTPAFMTLQDSLSSPEYSTPEPTTIKMEDLQKPQLPLSPPPESQKSVPDDASSPCTINSPSVSSDSKPTKKRKSWGQVLPEPKTNLPPRKRAKTEDEKEQRRIERVKRNRLAAHNSRERKRQEVEALQDEKKTLEDRVHQLEAMLRIYQQHAPDVKIDDLNLEPLTPLPSASSASSHVDDGACPIVNPRSTSFASMTPLTSPSLRDVDTPSYSDSQPPTPAPFAEATFAQFDATQHSAAMLCDPQCPSIQRNRQPSSAKTLPPRAATLSLMLNLLLPIMYLLSTTSSIIRAMTPILSMIGTSTGIPTWPRLSQASLIPRTLLMTLEGILTCTPPQAQQFLLATRLASQTQFNSKVAGLSAVIRVPRDDRDARRISKARRRTKPTGAGAHCKQDLGRVNGIAGVRLKRVAS